MNPFPGGAQVSFTSLYDLSCLDLNHLTSRLTVPTDHETFLTCSRYPFSHTAAHQVGQFF